MKSWMWWMLPIVAVIFILLAGADDDSPIVTHKSTYVFLTGPAISVDKLEELYDIDMLMIKVANLAEREITHANITILNGNEFLSVCGRDAEACYVLPNNIYLQSGWAISNMTGLPLAHEMAHLYFPKSQLAADQISCAIFPEFDQCYNVLPEIR